MKSLNRALFAWRVAAGVPRPSGHRIVRCAGLASAQPGGPTTTRAN
ncbi:hypothetical protein AB0L57_23965 [Nocardia sp. NPDC052254]